MTEITPQNPQNPSTIKESNINKEEQSTLELKKILYSICEPMCMKVAQTKPKDIPNCMIKYLKSTYGYSSSGLHFEEQKELESLRAQIEMFKNMEEHANYSELIKNQKKEVKPVEKKGRNQPKPKPRLPIEENIQSDDDDYKNLDDVDTNLDNLDYIKTCIENNKRISVTENCFVFDKDMPNIKTHKKSAELFEFVRINLIKSPVFSELNFDVLKCIIDAMEEKNFAAVADVVKQGELDETFFFVVEGQLECKMQFTKITQEGNRKKVERFDPKLVRIYNPGDYFGELSLLYHCPRRGTIRAITDVKLLVLSRSIYKQILRKANEEKSQKIIDALKKVKILSMLEDEEFEKLEILSKEAIYTNGETIIKENEFSNTLMILEKGKCVGTKSEENGKMPIEKSKYKEGDVLFEKAILRPEKSKENILANSDLVKFICIDRNGLKNNLGPYETILMRNMELYQQIFPPEEEKKEEEKKEEEKKEEEKKEEEKKEEEKKVENIVKISPEEQMKIMKEEHQKEIDLFQQQMKEKEEKYEQLLKLFKEQQDKLNQENTINTINNMNPMNNMNNMNYIQNSNNSIIPRSDKNNINNTNNNMIDMNNPQSYNNNINDLNNNFQGESMFNMNQYNLMDNNINNPENNINNPENNMNNMDANVIEQENNNNMIEGNLIENNNNENNINENENENNNIKEEKRTVSSNSQILRDKLIYNEKDEKMFYDLNHEHEEKENEPNNQNIEGSGSFIEN